MEVLANLLINALVVFIVSRFIPGIHINDFVTAIIVAFVLGALNFFVKPILVILTFPITILSLGLFLLVINTVIILLTSSLVSGFEVSGFMSAFIFAIVLSVTTTLLDAIFK